MQLLFLICIFFLFLCSFFITFLLTQQVILIYSFISCISLNRFFIPSSVGNRITYIVNDMYYLKIDHYQTSSVYYVVQLYYNIKSLITVLNEKQIIYKNIITVKIQKSKKKILKKIFFRNVKALTRTISQIHSKLTCYLLEKLTILCINR